MFLCRSSCSLSVCTWFSISTLLRISDVSWFLASDRTPSICSTRKHLLGKPPPVTSAAVLTFSSWFWRSAKASLRLLFSDRSLLHSASLEMRADSMFLHWSSALARSLSFLWHLKSSSSSRRVQHNYKTTTTPPIPHMQLVRCLSIIHLLPSMTLDVLVVCITLLDL